MLAWLFENLDNTIFKQREQEYMQLKFWFLPWAPSSRIHSHQCLSGCYPFTDKDPFLIESCPHVYFVGNQDKYGTHILNGIVS
jgi:hypothetical protein